MAHNLTSWLDLPFSLEHQAHGMQQLMLENTGTAHKNTAAWQPP
ncbi:MAG: hypothetical protein OEU44_07855 [Gammaproteobacteria bacterium]|nr:hypothetical protein [Gammaproteobacteria bacterium]